MIRTAIFRIAFALSLAIVPATLLSGYEEQPKPADEVAALIKVLDDPKATDEAKIEALKQIAKLGPKAKEALGAVGRTLASRAKFKVTKEAITTLVAFGREAHAVIQHGLTYKDLAVQLEFLNAAITLARTDPQAWPLLAHAWSSREPIVRKDAAEAFNAIGPQALPFLTPELSSPEPLRRAGAVRSLGCVFQGALALRQRASMKAVIAATKDKDFEVQRAAVEALAKFPHPLVARTLTDAVVDRGNGADTLLRLSQKGVNLPQASMTRIVDMIHKRLTDPDFPANPSFDFQLAELATVIGPPARGLSKDFRKWLDQTREPGPLTATLNVLWELERRPEIVLPTLFDAAKKDNFFFEVAASRTLRRIGTPALKGLEELAADERPETRQTCATALNFMEREGRSGLPMLLKLLDDKNPEVLEEAIHAIARLGRNGKSAAKKLASLMSNPSAGEAALMALVDTGSPDAADPKLLRSYFRYPPTSRLASECLIGRRTVDPETLEVLLKSLEASEKELRFFAAFTLGELRPVDKTTLAKLEKALSDADEDVRGIAARSLWRHTGDTGKALPVCQQLLTSKTADTRLRGLVILQLMQAQAAPALPLMIAELRRRDETTFKRLPRTLAAIGEPAVAELRKLLRSKDIDDVWVALFPLAEMGPDARSALPELTALLKHEDLEIREQTLVVLDRLAYDAGAATAEVAALLKHPELAEMAARCLAGIGPNAKAAIPALAEAIRTTDPDARLAMCSALGHIGSGEPAAVDALVWAIQNSPEKEFTEKVAQEAAAALAWIGPAAKKALPALVERIKTAKGWPRLTFAYAIARIEPEHEQGVSVLVEGTKADYWHDREQALNYLGPQRGKAAQAANPAIVKALSDPDPLLRRMAADSLFVGYIPKEAADGLVKLLKDPSPSVLASAMRALATAKLDWLLPHQKAIEEAFDDPDPEIKSYATFALLTIDPKHKRAAEARQAIADVTDDLIERVKENRVSMMSPGRSTYAYFYVKMLGTAGPGAKKAIPLLQRLSERDLDEMVRFAAKEALAEISTSPQR